MIGNSTTNWGWPAIVLHWIGAILILLLLGHGWWMTHLAPRPDRLAHYAAGLSFDKLTPAAIHETKRRFIDSFEGDDRLITLFEMGIKKHVGERRFSDAGNA